MYPKLIRSFNEKSDMDEALQELGLKRNEIKIVRALISAKGEELSAREISKCSELPISRTYALLKNLNLRGLVDKKIFGGVFFTIKDPEFKFHEFMKEKYRKIMENEKKIYETIGQSFSGQNAFIELKTDDEFYQAACQIAMRSKQIKAFARTPVLFFPEERGRSFLRDELFKIYKEKISSGTEFFYIINETHIKTMINKENKKKFVENMNFFLKHENFHISASDTQYLKMMKGERDAILAFRYAKSNRVTSGLHVRQKEVIQILDHAFNDIFDGGRQIKKVSDLIA